MDQNHRLRTLQIFNPLIFFFLFWGYPRVKIFAIPTSDTKELNVMIQVDVCTISEDIIKDTCCERDYLDILSATKEVTR